MKGCQPWAELGKKIPGRRSKSVGKTWYMQGMTGRPVGLKCDAAENCRGSLSQTKGQRKEKQPAVTLRQWSDAWGSKGSSLCLEWGRRDLPGGPVAKTPHSRCRVLGSIPGQGSRSHMPQLSIHKLQLKIPRAATKTQRSQIKKKKGKTIEGTMKIFQAHENSEVLPVECFWDLYTAVYSNKAKTRGQQGRPGKTTWTTRLWRQCDFPGEHSAGPSRFGRGLWGFSASACPPSSPCATVLLKQTWSSFNIYPFKHPPVIPHKFQNKIQLSVW